MDRSEKIQIAKKALKWRLDLLKEVFPRIQSIAETEGKKGVAQYFSDRFGIEPTEKGTDLLFKDWRFQFDDNGAFTGMSSGTNSTTRAVPRSDDKQD